ncbi:hypothetical protein [Gaetbulibacter sp. PBL-D1]|uniref:hypothetical protein n=1 Tax=Gaetbulibacter sp. PBL-D1 TaxID=3422594 RepID=UPI003D2EF972
MAKKVLINKKTGKEHVCSNPDLVLKKHPKLFKEKAPAVLPKDVMDKESKMSKDTADDGKNTQTEVKDKASENKK